MSDAGATSDFAYDVFVSHASEDKVAFVDDLVRALGERGVRVWYDSFEIALGDDFRGKMEQGLLGSKFGVVVLSPSFVQAGKYWTQSELSALLNLEAANGQKRVLPVLYGVSWQALSNTFPFAATRRAADASRGVDAVANEIHDAVRGAVVERPKGASPLYNVPLPSQSFVGRRRELDRLKEEFARGDVRVCASVEGLPGIGKTELVLKLAHELAAAGEFPGGVFWLPAEHPDLATAWASDAVAGALSIGGETVRERATNTVNAISRRTARSLVILDNVERWDKTVQPTPLPSGAHVTLLVTTRQSHLGGQRFRAFPLEFLGKAEARALVTGIAGGEIAGHEGFDALIDYLDGHALALELAAIYLREYRETPQAYLDAIRAGVALETKVVRDTMYERSVDQAFSLLWERLDEPTQRGWQLAAQFAPEPVTSALADACGLNADARHALHRYHLVDLDKDGRIRMHRLTRTFGQTVGDAATRARAREAFLDGVANRAEAIDEAVGYRIYVPDRAHFDVAVSLSQGVEAPRSSEVLDRVGTALHSMGELGEARDLFERALQSDLKNLGEDHPSVAMARSNLALVLKDLGKLGEARDLLERALQSDLKNLGDDHPTVARGRSNLATVLQDLGKLGEARNLLERALQSDLKNLGDDHPTVATRRSNLALVLQDLGEPGEARNLLERALQSDLKNLGDDHPNVASSRSNLALVLKDLGKLGEARDLLERALQSDLKNLGDDHPSVARGRSNLAMVLQDLGELGEARDLLERALQSDLKNLGDDHPTVATARSNLALVLMDLGERGEARSLLERTLKSNLKNLGDDHPNVAMARSNLATVLKDLGELGEARDLLERALQSDLKNLGDDHPTVATARFKLADMLEELGDESGALELLEKARRAEMVSLGTDHPSLALTIARIARLRARTGQTEEARTEAEAALKIVSRQPEGSWFRLQVETLTAPILRNF